MLAELGWELAAQLLLGDAWRDALWLEVRERMAPLLTSVQRFAAATTARQCRLALYRLACARLERARRHADAAMEALTMRDGVLGQSDVRHVGVQLALARRLDEQRVGGGGVLYERLTAGMPLRWLVTRLHPHVAAGGRLARLLLDPVRREALRRVRWLRAWWRALRRVAAVLAAVRVLGRAAKPTTEAGARRVVRARFRRRSEGRALERRASAA